MEPDLTFFRTNVRKELARGSNPVRVPDRVALVPTLMSADRVNSKHTPGLVWQLQEGAGQGQ